MNDKTGGSRLPRRAGGLAVVAAVGLLTAACGVVHVSVGSGSATPSSSTADYLANLAYAQCMRTHGEPNFPEPKPGSNIGVSGTPRGPVSGPLAKANSACLHLLPKSETSSNSQVPATELAAALKISECVRAHGVPSFPDPTVVNGAINYDYQGTNSSQFQTAVKACQSVIPKGVHLP